MRILLADDHAIVREGLTLMLEQVAGVTVVGSVGNGEEAVTAAQCLKPDVTIMDLVLPALNGIDATKRIVAHQPQARVLILSASKCADHVYRALRAGACGYVLKSAVAAELVVAVEEAIAGRQYISSTVEGLFFRCAAAGPLPVSCLESLSIRERDVLRSVVEGSTSAQIAKTLFLSPKTIDSYRARIMVKLGVSSRGELIRFALKHELPTV